ncbi:TPA: hypothetical protein TVR14_000841 [Streptococcus equi subsp. zooepidemicus]|uniref:hypothetical protein n=1 Tax=Streptococcus equi TaxID=1336 RepID=UPI0005C302EE|nr:hypothetical protein [Streptococcus equi]HEL0727834.1 hypothetical protein [Streptococcus equi subsp. zooepidemicus]KIS10334.1 secreted phage protein [Streptococcus equi subsp. zooepidemicus Sz57]HEL1078898.1 hypothetical protein [Streptococcus equi subsp. zooepidemicus]HEL1208447.1 hypothetical protein [Streptococcus equi subsp. zooepidemicus]HEL1265631.1 hypothetical protein [Streptococcus equi subsp. zooepidemicus]
MKKKLVMILALYLSTYAMNVSSSEHNEKNFYGFRDDWYLSQTFGIKPIEKGAQSIEIKTESDAIVQIFKIAGETSENKKIEELMQSQIDIESHKERDAYMPSTYKIKLSKAGHNGKVSFPLKDLLIYNHSEKDYEKRQSSYYPGHFQLKEGDTIRVTIKDSYGFGIGSETWTIGKSVPKNILEKEEEEQKQKETEQKQEEQRQIEKEQNHVEQKLLEDNMLKHIRENDHKTWYQRLGDNIEDTWANVKGWWKG